MAISGEQTRRWSELRKTSEKAITMVQVRVDRTGCCRIREQWRRGSGRISEGGVDRTYCCEFDWEWGTGVSKREKSRLSFGPEQQGNVKNFTGFRERLEGNSCQKK